MTVHYYITYIIIRCHNSDSSSNFIHWQMVSSAESGENKTATLLLHIKKFIWVCFIYLWMKSFSVKKSKIGLVNGINETEKNALKL